MIIIVIIIILIIIIILWRQRRFVELLTAQARTAVKSHTILYCP